MLNLNRDNSEVVFHGSHVGGLKVINKKVSTHMIEAVYASKNIALPLLFIRNDCNRDLDTLLNYDDGRLEIVERRPGLLEKIYNLEGYIYVLSDKNFTLNTKWKPEILSESDEEVLDVIYIDNVFDALIELDGTDKLKLYRYPERPGFIPLDNSDLIDSAIRREKHSPNNSYEKLLAVYPELKDKLDAKLNELENDISR